ncbi:MAG: cell division protein FtsX, partial [Bacteroidales bacterium]|nr:cell division protein FtsX [Bacteroidales bacterium]
YQKNLIHAVNENVRKMVFTILVFSGLLFFIALALINNTIRLAVYSKRFIIRTMQLVGATPSYIRKPFLWKGIFQGLLCAFLACLIVSGIVYYSQNEMKGIIRLDDFEIMITLYAAILCIGIFLNYFSTYLAVSKYIRIKTDKLYT